MKIVVMILSSEKLKILEFADNFLDHAKGLYVFVLR